MDRTLGLLAVVARRQGGEADFRFNEGKTRREQAAKEKAAAAARRLAAAQGEAARTPEAREGGQIAGMRDRARAGWDRVRIAASELSWRRFRRVFRKKRRAVVTVEGLVLAVELVGTVLWMAWESAREGWRREREATTELTAAELALRQQKGIQRRQQKGMQRRRGRLVGGIASEWSEGYCSGSNSDHTVGSLLAAQTPEEAEVAAAAVREWDRQHGWLHSPAERAADRRAS